MRKNEKNVGFNHQAPEKRISSFKRYKAVFLVFTAITVQLSCELSADIHADHDPVLQVDAVFYSGQPLPVIEIKRSFNATGRSRVEIDLESLLVSGADVVLTHNGNPVPVQEKSPGKYLPVTNERPAVGDVFHIEVSWEGKSVAAEARIPVYPAEDIEVNPGTSANISHITLDHWVYPLPVHINIPFLPDFTAVQTISETEKKLYEEAEFTPQSRCGCPWEYRTYFGDNFSGDTSLSLSQSISVMLPYEEGEVEPPTGTISVSYTVTIRIPEPIYVNYVRTRYDEIGATTVTNVEGGVGLFIGAIQFEKEMDVKVELK